MMKLVDVLGLDSNDIKSWGFESLYPYQNFKEY